MCSRALKLALVLIAFSILEAAQKTPLENAQTIALQFKPDDALWKGFSDRDRERNTCAGVQSTRSSGSADVIVAAYAQTDAHPLKLIKAQADGTYQVIDEPKGLALGGMYCEVELIDVDNDGIYETHVSFAEGHGITTDWIFKIEKGRLKNLTPTKPGQGNSRDSLLTNAMFFDLNHDGTLSIRSVGDPLYPSATPRARGDVIFSLKNGKYMRQPLAHLKKR